MKKQRCSLWKCGGYWFMKPRPRRLDLANEQALNEDQSCTWLSCLSLACEEKTHSGQLGKTFDPATSLLPYINIYWFPHSPPPSTVTVLVSVLSTGSETPSQLFSFTARDLGEVNISSGFVWWVSAYLHHACLKYNWCSWKQYLIVSCHTCGICRPYLGYNLILFTFAGNRVELYQRVYLH